MRILFFNYSITVNSGILTQRLFLKQLKNAMRLFRRGPSLKVGLRLNKCNVRPSRVQTGLEYTEGCDYDLMRLPGETPNAARNSSAVARNSNSSRESLTRI
ncbi:hypothetical protein BpHYR1_031360 [Brachionus plicatilis]|uniref:Uncharacterized protein n=1 Tax=Brachionus plicatilis TaxID=10195 RepID=A0A3M7QZK6_BRAPC|nr:hypothetical protein BpHYR1_031360 [Brachionus plicatilis]